MRERDQKTLKMQYVCEVWGVEHVSGKERVNYGIWIWESASGKSDT